MKRTLAATVFVLSAALIGAAAAVLMLGRSGELDDTVQPVVASLAITEGKQQHIISQYRVAVTFPDRYEFDQEVDGEVRYFDPSTQTSISFVVTRMSQGSSFDDALDGLIRSFSFRGVVERVEKTSNTRAEVTLVEVFRKVFQTVIIVGEDCWGKPLLAYGVYRYDRTVSPEHAWLTQNDDVFPQFEVAYRCPVSE